MSLDSFFLDATVTGRDLIDRLTDVEASCIGETLGEEAFEAFLDGPVVAEITRPFERPIIERRLLNTLFNCLAAENIPRLGVAFMDARAAGWTGGTRACVTEVATEHPEAVHDWLGLEREPDAEVQAHIADRHTYLLDIFWCFTPEEVAQFTLHTLAEAEPTTGEVLLDEILTPTEASCMTEGLPEGSVELLRDAPSLRDAATVPGVMGAAITCFDVGPELNGRIYANGFARNTGGLSEESRACLVQFVVDHPHYMELAQASQADLDAMSSEQIAEIGRDNVLQFECLTGEELFRYQEAFGKRLFD